MIPFVFGNRDQGREIWAITATRGHSWHLGPTVQGLGVPCTEQDCPSQQRIVPPPKKKMQKQPGGGISQVPSRSRIWQKFTQIHN